MSNATKTVRDVLIADSSVAALVDDRVEYLLKPQALTMPAITLQRVTTNPVNHLNGFAGLDATSVQVDYWAGTSTDAMELAALGRAALEAQNIQCDQEFDNYDPDIQFYRVTQEFTVWQ